MHFIPESFLKRFSPPAQAWIKRGIVVSPAIAVYLTLIFTRIYVATYGFHFELFWPPIIGVALPIPLAFLLWLRTWDRSGTHFGEFSISAAALSMVIFIVAFESVTLPILIDYRSYLAIAATASALFVFTGFSEPLRQLRLEPRTGLLAFLLGATVWLHTFLHAKLWQGLCEITAWVIQTFLKLMTIDVNISYVRALPVTPKPDQHPMPETEAVINIATEHFAVDMYSGCSGMDGLMIFFALMTIVTLIDWERFSRFKLWRLYIAGLLTIFLANGLRITLLFLLGNAASHPNAPEWLKPMKSTMLAMFHEHMGWSIYAVVFAIFITPIYRRAWEQDNAPEQTKNV